MKTRIAALRPRLQALAGELYTPDSLDAIARRMDITPGSCKVMCNQLYLALGIRGRVELLSRECTRLRAERGAIE